MIKNEKQFHNTISLISKAKESLIELGKISMPKGKNWQKQAQKQALLALIAQLQEQVEAYLALKTHKKKPASISLVQDLPTLLIQWRIYNGLTQQQLAKKLGWHYQQLQDYEKTDYSSATLQTIRKVADALVGPAGADRSV